MSLAKDKFESIYNFLAKGDNPTLAPQQTSLPVSHFVQLNDESRQLNCLVHSESTVFVVTLGRDAVVCDLKKEIKRVRPLDAVKDPHTLELWEVSAINKSRCEVTSLILLLFQPNNSNPIIVQPADTLAERIGSLGYSLNKFAKH